MYITAAVHAWPFAWISAAICSELGTVAFSSTPVRQKLPAHAQQAYAQPYGLPPEVASGFAQVLGSLTGSRVGS